MTSTWTNIRILILNIDMKQWYLTTYIFSHRYSLIYLFETRKSSPVGWDCRIHRLLLKRGVKTPPNESPRYDTKQSDGEFPVMLELSGMQCTPSLYSLPVQLWPAVVATDRVLCMGQIDLCTNAKLNCLK